MYPRPVPPAVSIADLPRPGAYQTFEPKVGTLLVVQLPGETMRCPVHKIVSPDAVIVKIDSAPMAKSHQFRFDDMVGVRRRIRDGRDIWEAQTDRDFLAEQKRMMAPPKPVVAPPVVEAVKEKPVVKAKVAVKKKPAGKRVGKGKKGRVG